MIGQIAATLNREPGQAMTAAPAAAPVRTPLSGLAANENGPGGDDPAVRLAAEALAREQARRERERRRAMARRKWLALLLAVLLTVVGLKLFAREVVRLAPGAAHLYRAVGVPVAFDAWRVEDMRIRWIPTPRGEVELSITGRIRNRSARPLPMPMVSLQLLNADGAPVYGWRIPPRAGAHVESGAMARFHTRIAHVPRNAFGLRVRVQGAAK